MIISCKYAMEVEKGRGKDERHVTQKGNSQLLSVIKAFVIFNILKQ